MSEVEKQESSKTVVAFITGLLIGGLLVWVFSAPTQENSGEMKKDGETNEVTEKKDEKGDDGKKLDTQGKAMVGKGAITVADQKAGNKVMLGTLEFPATSGWVAVRDSQDETLGNVFGASFYNVDLGIVPTEIETVRSTVAGKTYAVMFYSNEGAIDFSSTEDKMIEGVQETFTATE